MVQYNSVLFFYLNVEKKIRMICSMMKPIIEMLNRKKKG